MLARPINLKDPNSDWWPLHAWSNDSAIQYQLAQSGRARRYHEDLIAAGIDQVLQVPDVEVFAFQEMNKSSGKSHNDRNIFNSITSLIKAQAYELSSLPARKKRASVYQFNLISLVESEIVRLMFDGNKIEASQRGTEHFLARYIVRKSEIFSRIRFVQADIFHEVLPDYTRLATENCKWFEQQYDEFFVDIVKDSKRLDIFKEQFLRLVRFPIRARIRQAKQETVEIKSPWIFWSEKRGQLELSFDVPDGVAEFMNVDEKVREILAGALNTTYQYTGTFVVDDVLF